MEMCLEIYDAIVLIAKNEIVFLLAVRSNRSESEAIGKLMEGLRGGHVWGKLAWN